MSKNEGRNIAVMNEAGRQLYEGSVMKRMQGRAGAYTPTGAPGIAHEIMANDLANIKNTVNNPGAVTKLTKQANAQQLDAVTVKNGKVIERIQYKDTSSAGGLSKTMNQVKSGKYDQATLKGTKETTRPFNAAAERQGISKRMESTGISHKDTQRIGDKFTKQSLKTGSLTNTMAKAAGGAFVLTAVVEGGKSVMNGDSVGECTANVVTKGAESAINTACAAGAGEAAFFITSLFNPALAVPASIIATVATGNVVGECIDGAFDDFGDGIAETVDTIGEGISDVAETFTTGLVDTAECVADGVSEIAETICDSIGEAIEDTFSNVSFMADCFFGSLFGW